MTPRLHQVMDLARDEAARVGLKYAGTEHLLLGLLRLGEGLAWEVLVGLGMDLERARRAVAEPAAPLIEEGR